MWNVEVLFVSAKKKIEYCKFNLDVIDFPDELD